MLKVTSKSTDVIVLGCVEDLTHATHPIVCRFLLFKDKQKILQNANKLKDTGMFIYEDFCSNIMKLRKLLWEKVLEYGRVSMHICTIEP